MGSRDIIEYVVVYVVELSVLLLLYGSVYLQ